MVKILSCYLYAKKSYGILSKGAIFFWPTLYLSYRDDHLLHNFFFLNFCKTDADAVNFFCFLFLTLTPSLFLAVDADAVNLFH